jgi:hypothetical protein
MPSFLPRDVNIHPPPCSYTAHWVLLFFANRAYGTALECTGSNSKPNLFGPSRVIIAHQLLCDLELHVRLNSTRELTNENARVTAHEPGWVSALAQDRRE